MFIIDKWGKKRLAHKIICPSCKKEVIKRIYKNRKNVYCSPECQGIGRRKRITLICEFCRKAFEKQITRIKKHNFCCRKHKDTWQQDDNHLMWNGGKSSYRIRAIRKDGLKCNSGNNCPLNNFNLPWFMYEVDHVDGNRNNNKKENLSVKCVWCHRLKTYNNL